MVISAIAVAMTRSAIGRFRPCVKGGMWKEFVEAWKCKEDEAGDVGAEDEGEDEDEEDDEDDKDEGEDEAAAAFAARG